MSCLKNPNQDEIIRQMVWAYPSHDFAVDYEEAESLGLPVKLLDMKDDELLVDTMLELEEEGLSLYGFAKPEHDIKEQGDRSAPNREESGVSGAMHAQSNGPNPNAE